MYATRHSEIPFAAGVFFGNIFLLAEAPFCCPAFYVFCARLYGYRDDEFANPVSHKKLTPEERRQAMAKKGERVLGTLGGIYAGKLFRDRIVAQNLGELPTSVEILIRAAIALVLALLITYLFKVTGDELRTTFIPGTEYLSATYEQVEELLNEEGRARSNQGIEEAEGSGEAFAAHPLSDIEPSPLFKTFRAMAFESGEVMARALAIGYNAYGYDPHHPESFGPDDGEGLPTSASLLVRGKTEARISDNAQYREMLAGIGVAERPRRVLDHLVKSSGLENSLDWEIYTIPGPSDLDIFSTASGKLFITEQFVRGASTDEALAAIIAHEMGHVIRGHRTLSVTPSAKATEYVVNEWKHMLRQVKNPYVSDTCKRLAEILDRADQPSKAWRSIAPYLMSKVSSGWGMVLLAEWQMSRPFHWTEMRDADRVALKILSDAGIKMGHYQVWLDIRQISPLFSKEEFLRPFAGEMPTGATLLDKIYQIGPKRRARQLDDLPLVEKTHPSYSGRGKVIRKRLREVAKIAQLEELRKQELAAREQNTDVQPWWDIPAFILRPLPARWQDSLRALFGLPVLPNMLYDATSSTSPEQVRTEVADLLRQRAGGQTAPAN
jgi:hypothetical protein